MHASVHIFKLCEIQYCSYFVLDDLILLLIHCVQSFSMCQVHEFVMLVHVNIVHEYGDEHVTHTYIMTATG